MQRHPLSYCPLCLGKGHDDLGRHCICCEGCGVVVLPYSEPFDWIRIPSAVFEHEVCRQILFLRGMEFKGKGGMRCAC